jgi:hypothetical protein
MAMSTLAEKLRDWGLENVASWVESVDHKIDEFMTDDKVGQSPPLGAGGPPPPPQPPAVVADAGAVEALRRRIGLFAAWGANAKNEATGLTTELDRLAAGGTGSSLDALTKRVDEAQAGWRTVREHNVLAARLKNRFECLSTSAVDGRGNNLHPLAAQWTDFAGKEAAMVVPVSDRAGSGSLAGQRAAYERAAETLLQAWEASSPGPGTDYYDQISGDLWNAAKGGGFTLWQQASCIPVQSREMERLRGEMDASKAAQEDTARDAKQRCGAMRACVEAAAKLIKERRQANADDVRFYAAYRKVKPDLASAKQVSQLAGTAATPEQIQFTTLHAAFVAKLGSSDGDAVQACERQLPALAAAAEDVLRAATETLKLGVTTMKGKLQGTVSQKEDKATEARTIIDGTEPSILRRLTCEEQLDLLEGLRANGQDSEYAHLEAPYNDGRRKRSDASKDPALVAIYDKWILETRPQTLKLYKATSIDPAFAAHEERGREKIMATLSADKKKLQDARDNWSAMTPDQKKEIITLAANAQCQALGFPTPQNGIVIEEFRPPRDEGDNGHYSEKDKVIRINTRMPVYDDFELTMDLVFHENSHNRQYRLMQQFKDEPDKIPPEVLMQAKMFSANGSQDVFYSGMTQDNDFEAYQGQPMENNAWTNGPRTAQALIDMLAAA